MWIPTIKFPAIKPWAKAFCSNPGVQKIASALAAVALVALAFESIFFVAHRAFSLTFLLFPLYFVVTCAMIAFALHFIGGHEPLSSR